MTKIHEEYIRGKASEILEKMSKKDGNLGPQIGEFSLYISGNY